MDTSKELNIWERLKGRKGEIFKAIEQFEELQKKVERGKPDSTEIPILQFMSKKKHDQTKCTEHLDGNCEMMGEVSTGGLKITDSYKTNNFEQILSDNEVYQDYFDSVLHSFPFSDILRKIKLYLQKINMNKLIIFLIIFLKQDILISVYLSVHLMCRELWNLY